MRGPCVGAAKNPGIVKTITIFLTEDPGVFPDVFPSFLDYVHVGGALAKEEPRVLLGSRVAFFSSDAPSRLERYLWTWRNSLESMRDVTEDSW